MKITESCGHFEESEIHVGRWWRQEEEKARCLLCPHACLLSAGATGRCGVRTHVGDKGIVARNYGLVSSLAVDPVEKKPLYHWKPGTRILSLGSTGCSMRCPFCQNWQLAECAPSVPLKYIGPEGPASIATAHGIPSVAFTYNEPLTWFEYIVDACRFLSQAEIPAVLVSNGMINSAPLEELIPLLSAANIDLKAFDCEAYRFLGGELETVMETIRKLSGGGVHVEVTFLLVPGINDDPSLFSGMISWLASLEPIPALHISRYFPNRVWTSPPTPIKLLNEFVKIAEEKLPWVYTGNVDDVPGGSASDTSRRDTRCSGCGRTLISRRHYNITENNLDGNGRCIYCKTPSPITL